MYICMFIHIYIYAVYIYLCVCGSQRKRGNGKHEKLEWHRRIALINSHLFTIEIQLSNCVD